MSNAAELSITAAAIVLVLFMGWSLWSLSNSPLSATQRLWWVLAVIILPGIGSLAWLWWIKRYYPRRKAADPDWDPAAAQATPHVMARPRPGRGRYKNSAD